MYGGMNRIPCSFIEYSVIPTYAHWYGITEYSKTTPIPITTKDCLPRLVRPVQIGGFRVGLGTIR